MANELSGGQELMIEHSHGHLFHVVDGKRLLLDTGAPSSMGNCEIPWRGDVVDLAGRMSLVGLGDLSELVGAQLDGLIGADLLLDQDMTLDIPGGRLWWGPPREGGDHAADDGQTARAAAMPMRQMLGVPICDVQVGDASHAFAIDTGASRTFIGARMADGLPRTGTIEDFYPGMGSFETPTVSLNAEAGAHRSSIDAGILPPQLDGIMQMFNIEGIVGLDVLAAGPMSFGVSEGQFHPRVGLGCAGTLHV